MKKHIFLFAALSFAAFAAKAQNTFPNSGNVGIGTTSPTEKLDVIGNVQITNAYPAMLFKDNSNSNYQWTVQNFNGAFRFIDHTANDAERFRITPNGNFGFNTPAPPTIGNYGVLALNGKTPSQGGYFSLMTNGSEVGAIVANSQLAFQTASGITTQFFTGSNATMQIAANGNVGIGTISPTVKLDVAGNEQITNAGPALTLNDNSNSNYQWTVQNMGGAYRIIDNTANNNERFRINPNGNFGFNTAAPPVIGSYGVLAVNGRSPSQGGYISLMTNGSELGAITANSQLNIQAAAGIVTQFVSGATPTMQIATNGNVGIGMTNPDQKLSVAGIIHAQGVKVDMNGWSDYVFKPQYHLKSLVETKAFIDKNHHLPDMPSENDVIKNGINLGDVNIILLKKIEELTLYLITMEQQNTVLSKRVLALERSK